MPTPGRFTSGALLTSDVPLPLDAPFTTRQAEAAGVTRTVLARLQRDGYVRRLLKGVHVAAQVRDSLALRTAALRLVVPEEAVVTDWTACWLWTGLLAPGAHLEIPPVCLFLPAGRGRLRNGLCDSGERAFHPDDVVVHDGLRVTAPLRTAWDLGRLAHRDVAIGALDGLLRRGDFSRQELLDGVERFRRQRGVVQLRALAPLADPRAESPGESVLRLRWLDLPSLPAPTPQVPVMDEGGRIIYRLDLGVEELRFSAEYDGEEHHTTEADRAHDEQRRRWLRQQRGWIIVPVRRHNVHGPTRDVERLLYDGVDAARRRLGSLAV